MCFASRADALALGSVVASVRLASIAPYSSRELRGTVPVVTSPRRRAPRPPPRPRRWIVEFLEWPPAALGLGGFSFCATPLEHPAIFCSRTRTPASSIFHYTRHGNDGVWHSALHVRPTRVFLNLCAPVPRRARAAVPSNNYARAAPGKPYKQLPPSGRSNCLRAHARARCHPASPSARA